MYVCMYVCMCTARISPTLVKVIFFSACIDLLGEDVFAYSCIHGTEWVIQQIHVGLAIHCPGQVHTSLLTATQNHTSFTYHRLVAIRQRLQILTR